MPGYVWLILAVVVAVGVLVALRGAGARGRDSRDAPAAMLRARSVIGRPVVTIDDATNVGTVDDVLFDSSVHSVVAFRVRDRAFGHRAALTRDNVAAIGPDAIMVAAATAVNDLKRLPALADAVRLDRLRGTRVVTQGGELLGRVWDVETDPEARRVLAYELRGSPWQRLVHRRPEVFVDEATHIGEAGIIAVEPRGQV